MGEQPGQSHSALRIVAACQSTTEFVAAYARYCEGRSLFIATKSPKSVGQIVKFKIALASGEHLMTGVGPVVERFGDRENRFGRPGMRVEVEKLDAAGRHWMEQLRHRISAAPSPAVVSASTGMFSTVSDESTATHAAPAAAPAPAPDPVAPAPPVLPPVAPEKPAAVPVAVADNLSAGWEIDGLPAAPPLPPPRLTPVPIAARNGEKSAEKAAKNGEKKAEKNGEHRRDGAQESVVVSGEVDVPPPLPPPPTTPAKGRSKRITFPALMFNKPRGLAVPAPAGGVVPKPLALLPATSPRQPGKLRPPTAPVEHESAAPAEREPAAPVAPLGTPSDTEPHVMVPRELESSLARPLEAADGTPPPAAQLSAPPFPEEIHPDFADAPAESSDVITSAPDSQQRPRRAKASTTTPPPVWAERTVTQTLAALVGGRPDPRVQEETVHWTNPGFAALKRPEPPQVDIVEEELPAASSAAVPVVVGVELSSGLDRTVVSPPPVAATSRTRLIAALAVTAVAGIGAGYFLGVRQGLSIEKVPAGELAKSSAGDGEKKWLAECGGERSSTALMAAAPVAEEAETAEPATSSAQASEIGAPEPATSRARSREPVAQPCFMNAMTSPVGATVLVDGRVAGRTPIRTRVACGRHSVRFEMESYQAATRTVTVRRGDTEKVSAELSRPRTVLRVESTPAGATVLVNGSSVGVTPLTTTVPGFVSSTVTLSKAGYKPVSKQISPTSTSARVGLTLKADSRPAARGSVSRRR